MIATRWYWIGFIASGILLAVAYFYFQQTLGLAPCPLCMFQRASLVAVMVFCLIGMLLRPQKIGSKFLALGITLSTLLGLLFAGRQVWLQHLPADQVPECGPDLAFMMEVLPLRQVIETVLTGSGSCAEVDWVFIGLSMGEWMVVVFSTMFLLALRLLLKRQRNYFTGKYGQ